MKHLLEKSEYVEQGYLFQLLRERQSDSIPMQEMLRQIRFELLTTTKLPLAIDYLLTELRHSGTMSPAMYQLAHYFSSFQAYVILQAEEETGRFTIESALQILEAEAKYRADGATPQGLFFFHFEVLCRNRLNYDKGLTAISGDASYDADWTKWILMLRAQIGLIDTADLIFLASEDYQRQLTEAGQETTAKGPFLFGRREGRIAWGNRQNEPLFLFAAMQRHLGYPEVPRPEPLEENPDIIPQLSRRIERLESRIKLLEEERRGGIDITKFYEKNKAGMPRLDR